MSEEAKKPMTVTFDLAGYEENHLKQVDAVLQAKALDGEVSALLAEVGA